MALEQLFLDPPEVATDRTELALHAGAILVGPAGPNWGDAQIEAYLADAARGSLPVDFRVPNRTIEIPLMLGASAGVMTFDEARTALQQKVALIQHEGGWLKRVLRDGRAVYADLIDATLRMGGGTLQAQHDLDADVVLTLQALPDWYGEEEDLGAVAASSDPELIFTLPGVRGDYPGRVRIVIDDESGQAQRGLLWGLRSGHYSAAPTAKLAYQAEALTPLDAAAAATVAGASVIRHASLSTGWTPVLSTQIAGVGQMTHTGSYRVWARVYTTALTPPRLRLQWDVGDLVNPVTNPADTIPGSNSFYLVNLGTVRLDPPPVGVHRWQGALQAAGATGDNVSIDRLWLIPVDDGYGELRAPVAAADSPGLAGYIARDEFDQPAGGLTGKTLPVGGAWTYLTGDTDDYTVDAPTHTAQRATISDTAARLVGAGATASADVLVQADVRYDSPVSGNGEAGLFARYVDASNYLYAVLQANAFSVVKVVGGAATVLGSSTLSRTSAWSTVRLVVNTSGGWSAWLGPQGLEPGTPLLSGADPVLAAGGALASGKSGLFDRAPSSGGTPTRSYDNFTAYVPAFDAVLNASLSAELRTDGMYRQSADGNGYGQVSHVIGDLPRLPAAGMEGRVTEVILKPSRGEPGVDADPASDAISAHVYARPSWLFVPEA